jgi:hypothetical protein
LPVPVRRAITVATDKVTVAGQRRGISIFEVEAARLAETTARAAGMRFVAKH